MTSFLDAMPKQIAAGLSKHFRDAVLTRDGAPGGDSWNPTDGDPQSFTCKAINSDWGAFYRANGLVTAADRMVLILAATLATEPREGDRIMIEGVTLTVVSSGEGAPAVSSDPAKATWTIRARA